MNPLKAKLAAGGTITSFLVTMPNIGLVQLLARSGIDALVMDMEHGHIDAASLHAMITATQGTTATPLVRVPCLEPWVVKPVLDAGAFGIFFPVVSSAEDARATVRAIRYPPLGERGLAPSQASVRWGMTLPQYLEVANDDMLNVVLIEHPDAVENLDEILAVPGIDVAVVALYDLSAALGVPGQRTHPKVLEVAAVAERKILAAGVTLGGSATSREEASAMVARGYRQLTLGFDNGMIQRAAAEALQMVAGL